MAGEWICQKELAGRLQISDRQVRVLTTRGIPTNGEVRHDRRYPWPAAWEWYVRFTERAGRARGHGRGGHPVDRARIAALRAEAERVRLEIDWVSGNLLVTKRVSSALDTVREQFPEARGALERVRELLGI